MGFMVGGQCFRLFADDVIAVKIDAHQERNRLVSIVSAGQPVGAGAATRPICSPAPAVCPHGSPFILHFSGRFLERQFNW
jgi:hypothetical protein